LTKPLPLLTVAFRRADICAFWIVTTVVLSLVLGTAAYMFGAPMPSAWAIVALAAPLPGLVWRRWFELGVRVWNKVVLSSRAPLRAYVLKIGYYLLFAAVGRTGSSLDVARRGAEVSRWIGRPRQKPEAGDCHRSTAGDGWWGRELLASARRPGNAWQVCLLPIVLLLLVLRDDGYESALPSSTYTLY
jgi:hypothetical protein